MLHCPHAQPREEPEPALPGRVVVNLGLLIALGVAASAWVLYYTHWFPVIGSLLGLGGLFAWVAFMSGLLTEDRKKQFQKAFESRVLLKERVWVGVLVFAVLFVLFATMHGSIVFHSLADDQGRKVEIRTPDPAGEPVYQLFVPPREIQKRLVFTGWGGRGYEIKPTGLPAVRMDVAPLGRGIVSSPSSFQARPVLLIRPEPRVSNNAEQNPFRLVVRRDGKEIGSIPAGEYRGEAVWVGCDANVQVPAEVTSRWRLEMLRDKISQEVLARWASPLALATTTRLQARDSMRAELLREDGSAYAEGEAWIALPQPGQGFVNELQIKIVRKAAPDAEPPES